MTAALALHPGARLVLREASGELVALETAHWHESATAEERHVLAAVDGPVLDLGCGPGRLVVALAQRGVPALGVDSSPSAVAIARRQGAAVLERDLFGRLPGEGRWATVLLFDGNVGIGGDPTRLLHRARRLTGGRGRVLAEVAPPGAGYRQVTAWVERDDVRSPRFPWAVVGADAIGEVARSAGLEVAMLDGTPSGRWFVHLRSMAAA